MPTRKKCVLAAAVVVAAASAAPTSRPALAASGTWNSNSSGNWSDTTKWLNGIVADGTDSTASFVVDINGDRTVTSDAALRTIGNLTFTDSTTASNNWVLAAAAGNVVALDRSDATRPTINVTNQTATISAVVTGGDGMQKSGGGTLVMSGANTYAGGTVLNASAGALRAGADTVVTAGAIVSGPFGVGDLTLSGSTLQDSGGTRTLAYTLNIAGGTTFASTGTGSLVFNGTTLTTPATVNITAAAAPTLTVNNTTTFANPIAGTVGFTKAGTGTLNVNADSSATWTGAPTAGVSGGVLRFGALNALPQATGRTVTAAANGTATVAGPLTQAFVDRLALGSAGVVALSANTPADAVDFTGFTGGLRLGSTGAFTYGGTHTPATPGAYRLGGGGGTLTYAPSITGTGSVNVGNNGTATGAVTLSNAANDFTGGLTVDAGVLAFTTADGAAGAPSPLGTVPAAPAVNITLLNGGLVRYGGAAATLNPNRSIALGTGGGGIDTGGNNVAGFTNALSGTGGFIKDGAGTLTLVSALPVGPLTVRGGGTTAGTASVLNMNGQSASVTTLFLTGANAVGGLPATLANVNNLTAAGAVTVGSDGPAQVTINAGGQVNVDAAAANFIVFNRPTANTLNPTAAVATLDAAAAASVSLNVNNLIVANGNAGAAGSGFTGTLTLPTGAASTVNITTAAAGAVRAGVLNNNGATANLTFGGGTNVVRTNTLSVGAGKVTGVMTIAPGGNLDVQGLAGGKTALSIGDNNANTGIGTDSRLDLTGGSIGSAAVPARFGAVTVAVGTTGNSGISTGRLVIDGAASVVELDSVTLATGRSTTTSATTGIFQIKNGTVRVMAGVGIVPGTAAGTGARTSTLELLGGTLDMQGNNIGSLTNLTFSGGTLRDLGNVSRGLTQTGGLFEITAAQTRTSTDISGAYALSGGTARVAGGEMLRVSTALTVGGAGTLTGAGEVGVAGPVTIAGTVAPGQSIGTLTITSNPAGVVFLPGGTLLTELDNASADRLLIDLGPSPAGTLDLTAAGDNLVIAPLEAVTTQRQYTIATFAGYVNGDPATNRFSNVLVDTGAGLVPAGTDPAGPNFVSVAYNPTSIQVTVNNLSAVPEPASLGLAGLAAVGLLARRRRRLGRS